MAAPKEGGFKIPLSVLKGKVGFKASPAPKDVKRPRLALDDDEEDDSNKQQEIAGWDASEGGAIDVGGKKEKERPRIIPALPNRNWREDARRKQLTKAPHTQVQSGHVEVKEPLKMQFGLTILKKEEPHENGAEEEPAPAEPMEDVKDNLNEEQRLEKKALDSLINGKSTDDDLIIPVLSEADALRNALHDAPDAPSLEAYEAMPIEGFGAALLRGMGWKDGEAIGNGAPTAKPKEIKRRPALLGIGAKEEAAVGVELGDWGRKGKGRKVAQSYNPVALRNKITGELITEEELKAKLEQQDIVQDEKLANQGRKHSDDEEGDDRRYEKRRDKRDDGNRDRRRDDDYDSERRSRKDDRRREKDDYYVSDRKRDKRKDKYRDDEYDSERRKDKRREKEDDYVNERRRDKHKERDRRDRSRSPEDDRRDKKRDCYRSRSRDSKRERDRRDRSRDSDDRRKRRRERV